jgi:hypothetical protein
MFGIGRKHDRIQGQQAEQQASGGSVRAGSSRTGDPELDELLGLELQGTVQEIAQPDDPRTEEETTRELRALIASVGHRATTNLEVSRAVSAAARSGDVDELARRVNEVFTLAQRQAADREDWDEVMRLMEQVTDSPVVKVLQRQATHVTAQMPEQASKIQAPEVVEDPGSAWRAPTSRSTPGQPFD